jgi:P2-related tail formation protein
MHTEKQLQNACKAIESVMAVATEGMSITEQREFETDALAMYFGLQVATLNEADRPPAIAALVAMIDEVVDVRSSVSMAA